jgi:hypothetical protein
MVRSPRQQPDAPRRAGSRNVQVAPLTRDDRVLGVTRALAALVALVLAVAFVLLFGFPDRTDALWAWTIRPQMTALLMGSGYLGGALYFVGVLRARAWHTVGLTFLPITVFVLLMGLATLLHLDRFNHAHPSFWAWALLYAATPIVVPAVWWANRRHDPGRGPHDAAFAPITRWLLAVTGAVQLAAILIAFAWPQLLIDLWPWSLTPLTARVVAGWFSLPGAFLLALAWDGRVGAARPTMWGALLGIVLILASAARAWGDFDPTTPARWWFVAFFVALSVPFAAILLRRRPA